MKAILYVLHGSRLQSARREAEVFCEQIMNQIDCAHQAFCYLELAQPSIGEAIDDFVAKGVTHLFVQPILLLSAAHDKEDIPEELEHAQQKYRDELSITYGAPLG
ncbi:MAG: sirohydrochlorin chelatase [Bacilli bacterium]